MVPEPGESIPVAATAPETQQGYDLGPEPEREPAAEVSEQPRELAKPANQRRRANDRAEPRPTVKPVEALTPGLLPPPERQEDSTRGSLLYPLWDSSGLAILLTLPPLCAVSSVFSFGLRDYVTDGDEVERMGALLMIFPAGCILLLVMASGFRYLEQVAETTSRGEVRPPRRPAFDVFESLACLLRWGAALGPGLLLTGFLGWRLHVAMSPPGGTERVSWVELASGLVIGAGLALGAMPLLAVSLLGAVGAANPLLTAQALGRTGSDGLEICGLFGAFGMCGGAMTAALYLLPGIGTTIMGVLVFWVLFWYAAIVLMRRLGLFHRHHSRKLGWIRSAG